MSYATLIVKMVPPEAGKLEVGHMWVSIARPGLPPFSFGFYPETPNLVLVTTGAPGKAVPGDDGKYTNPAAQVEFPLTEEQFLAAIEFCQSASDPEQRSFGQYKLFSNSCVDFAWAVVRQCGIPVGASTGFVFHEMDGNLRPEDNVNFMKLQARLYAESGYSYTIAPRSDSQMQNNEGQIIVKDNVQGSGTGDILSSGLGDDRLHGFSGNDRLSGGSGADSMYGGTDDDVYVAENINDKTIEKEQAGFDTVEVHEGALMEGAYMLQEHIEKGVLVESIGVGGLTGNQTDNVLVGNSFRNNLTGGAGNDQLYGNDGDDTLIGSDDAVADVLAGGWGKDVYFAGDKDVIIDVDQNGFINFEGEKLTGGSYAGKFDSSEVYKDSITGTTYYYDTSSLLLTVVRAGQQIFIENFRNVPAVPGFAGPLGANLGISLRNGPSRPQSPLEKVVSDAISAGQVAAPIRRDPLALDLNNDGQISTIREGSGARFDFDANGFAESAGWVAPSDGLVVRDLNGNGSIDSGRELFGDQTLLPNGIFASNGFQAIAALDSNSDGKVDLSDAAWGELRIWRDADSDGQTDAGELLTMSEAGVSAINTAFTSPNQLDGNGNILAQSGTFNRADGSTGKAGSFLFERDPMDSVATEYLQETTAIKGLPDIQAFGNVHSLRQAMARSSSLEASVAALAASTDYKNLRAGFDALVQQWTGAAAVAPNSRGALIDARQLAVLEAFYGEGFSGVGGANPNETAAPILKTAYTQLVDGLYAQYLAQCQLKPVWEKVTLPWNETTGAVAPDFSGASEAMQALLGATPSHAVQMLYEFGKSAKQFGLDTSAGFAAFKAEFAGSPFHYEKVLQAGVDGVAFSMVDASSPIALSEAGIRYVLGSGTVTGSSGVDILYGDGGASALSGGAGNDSLFGGQGTDTLNGGLGSDFLDGGAGDDVLGTLSGDDYNHVSGSFSNYNDAQRSALGGNTYRGGTGNDQLRGTMGNDTYLFDLGDGNDTIVEESLGYGGVTDKLVFGSGIAAADISVTRVGNDLLLRHSNGSDSVRVQGWYDTTSSLAKKLERVEFADGTVWTGSELSTRGLAVSGTAGDDSLTGTGSFANVIDGGAGNDVITGGAAGDTLLGGAGNDTLNGVAGNDSLFGGEGADTLNGGLGSDFLDGGAGDDVLGTLSGDDYNHVSGSFSNYTDAQRAALGGNTYRGGTGNDQLRGTMGNDTYLFDLGDGNDTIVEESLGYGGVTDKLVFGSGIAAADISVTRVGNDLLLRHANGSDSVRVQGWYDTTSSLAKKLERVEFADGTVWTGSELSTRGLAVSGTAGDDSLTGTGSFANVIDGGAGNDVITGGAVGDTLLGGAGNDTLNGVNGNDSLFGGEGTDTLNGGLGSDLLDGGAGDDVLGTLSGDDYNHVSGSFSNYNDAQRAALGGNTYRGGTGNDQLRGTMGNDTYLFDLGDGNDTIVEESLGYGGVTDKLVFGSGIAAADISVTRVGNDLLLRHANGSDSVRVQGWYDTTSSLAKKLERVEFADGSTWSASDIVARVQLAGAASLRLTSPSNRDASTTYEPEQDVTDVGLGDLLFSPPSEPSVPVLVRTHEYPRGFDLSAYWAQQGTAQDVLVRTNPVLVDDFVQQKRPLGLLVPVVTAKPPAQEFQLLGG
jgi:Ca2+-binding RTX toxin-like protein